MVMEDYCKTITAVMATEMATRVLKLIAPALSSPRARI